MNPIVVQLANGNLFFGGLIMIVAVLFLRLWFGGRISGLILRVGFIAGMVFVVFSQSSHRKRMKTIENKGFLTTPNAMGRSVSVKTPANFKIPNEINGFVHDSYGTAL